jgi:hypothetical protein
VPEAVPVMPPPSKRLAEPGAADIDIPVLPEDMVLAPVRFPAMEVTPEHVAMPPVAAGGTGDTPEVVGLTPTDPSSVVPNGIPVPGTGDGIPRPSGVVMPSGAGALVLSWADAPLQPNKTSASAANTERVIGHSPRVQVLNRRTGSAAHPSALFVFGQRRTFDLMIPAFPSSFLRMRCCWFTRC